VFALRGEGDSWCSCVIVTQCDMLSRRACCILSVTIDNAASSAVPGAAGPFAAVRRAVSAVYKINGYTGIHGRLCDAVPIAV